jgi:hypothetical protein
LGFEHTANTGWLPAFSLVRSLGIERPGGNTNAGRAQLDKFPIGLKVLWGLAASGTSRRFAAMQRFVGYRGDSVAKVVLPKVSKILKAAGAVFV